MTLPSQLEVATRRAYEDRGEGVVSRPKKAGFGKSLVLVLAGLAGVGACGDGGGGNGTGPGEVNSSPSVVSVSGLDNPYDVGQSVSLSADVADDDKESKNQLSKVIMNWGDGSADTVGVSGNSGSASFTHIYAVSGEFDGEVEVLDKQKASDFYPLGVVVEDTVPVDVNDAPVLSVGGVPGTFTLGDTTVVDWSVADPDTLASQDLESVVVSWGDGSADTTAVSGQSASGTAKKVYDSTGVKDISVVASDGALADTALASTEVVAPATRVLSGEVIGFFTGDGGRNSARVDSSGPRLGGVRVYSSVDSAVADAGGNYSLEIPGDSASVLFVPGEGGQRFLEKGIVVPPGAGDLERSVLVYNLPDSVIQHIHDVVLSLNEEKSDDRNAAQLDSLNLIPDGVWTMFSYGTVPDTFHIGAGYDVGHLNSAIDSLKSTFGPATLGIVDYGTFLVHDDTIDDSLFAHSEMVKTSDTIPAPDIGIAQMEKPPGGHTTAGSANFYDTSTAGYALIENRIYVPLGQSLNRMIADVMCEFYASLLGGPEGYSTVETTLSGCDLDVNAADFLVLQTASHLVSEAKRDDPFVDRWFPDYVDGFVDPRK